MTKIFVSYRRDDSADITGRIYDRLIAQFGRENVFKDVDSIPFGVNFKTYLDDQVKQCSVLLAVIGKQWASITDDNGNRRLDNPRDFVRIEIESALQRGIPVIPVLVQNAVMPNENELAPLLAELTYRNGTLVRRDPDFHRDMNRLIKGMEDWLTVSSLSTQSPVPSLGKRHTASPPNLAEILPPPFEWCHIPTGEVVITEVGGYLRGPTTFKVVTFNIGKYPVTNAQFAKFIEADGYNQQKWWTEDGWRQRHIEKWKHPQYWNKKWNQPDNPVNGISWFEAIAFCHWLNDLTRGNITLPTEHQWQRAAQGDDGRVYPWGNEVPNTNLCNFGGSIGQTTPVNQYPLGISSYGVMDMCGNVAQWCLTARDSGNNDEQGNSARIRRGGWFNGQYDQIGVSHRLRSMPIQRYDSCGFRLAHI